MSKFVFKNKETKIFLCDRTGFCVLSFTEVETAEVDLHRFSCSEHSFCAEIDQTKIFEKNYVFFQEISIFQRGHNCGTSVSHDQFQTVRLSVVVTN